MKKKKKKDATKSWKRFFDWKKQVLFENDKKYNKQYNFSPSLIRKQKPFFSNVNTQNITDNKTFCKTVKPTCTEKVKPESKILAWSLF